MDENTKWLILLGVIVVLIAVIVISSIINNFKKNIRERENKIKEQDLIIQRNEAEMHLIINQQALAQFETFKLNELAGLKRYFKTAQSKKQKLYWLNG